MHAPANSENRIDWSDILDGESTEERRLRIRRHAFGDSDAFAEQALPLAEGGDFALVWPRRNN